VLMETESVPKKYLRERLGQRNPENDLTIRRNVCSYMRRHSITSWKTWGFKNSYSIVIIIIIIIIILHIYLKLRTVTSEPSRMRSHANLRTVQHVEAYCLEVCLHCMLSKYQYDINKKTFVGMQVGCIQLYLKLFASNSVTKLLNL
jgi:hypothetical protein